MTTESNTKPRLTRVHMYRGGTKLLTYTLQTESGASLRGAGWTPHQLPPSNPNGWNNRDKRKRQAITGQLKIRWETTQETSP